MLKFSEDAFNAAKKEYDDEANEMKDLANKIKDAMDAMDRGWDTPAATAFKEKFDDTWYKNMINYQEVIRHMAENAKIASEKYKEVQFLAECISIENSKTV